MKILINEEQSDKLGDVVEKLIMLRYGDTICEVEFDPETDDESVFWVLIYFKEKWYDSLDFPNWEVRIISKKISDFVNLMMGVRIRTGISLKDC